MVPDSESSSEVLDKLLDEGVDGLRVAVVARGDHRMGTAAGLLRCPARGGAEVLPVPVYRWQVHPDVARIDKLIAAVIRSDLDAITFTSAPAVAALFTRAKELARWPRSPTPCTSVPAFCVGSVTAGPLEAQQVPTIYPHRYRLARWPG